MRSPNHDDRQDGPIAPVPEIPPIRLYRIVRYTEGGTIIDVRTFEAHEHDFFPAGATLRTFHVHTVYGPTVTARTLLRPSSGWMEIEELLVEPTSVLLVGSGVSLQ